MAQMTPEAIVPVRDFVLLEKIDRYVQTPRGPMAVSQVVEPEEGGVIVGVAPEAEAFSELRLQRGASHYRIHRLGPKAVEAGFAAGDVVILDCHYSRATLVPALGDGFGMMPCEGIAAKVVVPEGYEPKPGEETPN